MCSADGLKVLVDNATVDMLLRPDWDLIIRIVDAVNSCSNQITINEIVFVIRKKFSSSQPKVVFLSLTLIEALVKNCGHRIYTAVNQDSFLKELGKVTRKFNNKTGAESAEVFKLALDIVQAWGEAFLPLQHKYGNITKLYQDLRKEKMPFNSQYDRDRVPILTNDEFNPSNAATMSYGGGLDANTANDELFAAALAASISETPDESRYRASSSSQSHSVSGPKNDIVQTVQTSKSILSEIILAASSAREVISNELAQEIYTQLTFVLNSLAQQIESELMINPEVSIY